MSHQLLAVGLLGFGMAAALLKQLKSLSTGMALLIVVPCILIGFALSYLLDCVVNNRVDQFYMPAMGQFVYLALILFIVAMKIKQRA